MIQLRPQSLCSAWVLMALMLGANPCKAKPPPLALAAHVGYRSAHQLRLVGEVQWALTDILALTLRAGPGFLMGPVNGTFMAGAVARLDALTWVPGVFVLGGMAAPHVRPTVQVGLELKRYVSLHTAWVGQIAAEWAGANNFAAVALFGASYQF